MSEKTPQLIVMLTKDDRTVMDAAKIYEGAKTSKARIWGFKEEPLPRDEMKALFGQMKKEGKTTALEVVAYSEEEGLAGAQAALDCGCDILMGTMFYPSINAFCKEHGMRYMPYVGKVTERPSILEGTAEEMIAEAKDYIAQGAWGINLLGYRYTGDASALIRALAEGVDAPVCVAGSVDSFERLDELKDISPWAFTIGTAFFEHAFGDDFGAQIDTVCERVS